MIYYGFHYSWVWGENLVKYIGLDPKNEIYATAGCLTVLRLYWTVVCDLPFDIYNTFVLEQKHNFNNETPLFFIKDRILKFFVAQVSKVIQQRYPETLVKFILYKYFYWLGVTSASDMRDDLDNKKRRWLLLHVPLGLHSGNQLIADDHLSRVHSPVVRQVHAATRRRVEKANRGIGFERWIPSL